MQREAHLGSQELVEPVVARLGVMLEFEFAGSYEVRNYGTETVEEPNDISIIGPQSWRRSRLIIRGHIESLVVMFQPCGFHALFGVPTEPLAQTGTEGHSVLGPAVSHLHQHLGNARSFKERARMLDAFYRLSRTRDSSQRQLPTDHDHAVSTREYQTDQSSRKLPPAAAGPVFDKQTQPYKRAGIDRVTPYQWPDSSPRQLVQHAGCYNSRLSASLMLCD